MSVAHRDLRQADLDALVALDRALFSPPWPATQFQRAIESDQFAVGAFAERRLIGYLIGSVVAGEGELLQVGVDSAFRRTGVAAALFTRFETWLAQQRAETLFLEVRASSTPALAFYRSRGFDQVGCRRDYYPTADGREDALLLCLTL